jgi:hypothetical protein
VAAMSGADVVVADVVVQGSGASGRGRVTVLRLSWRRADPLAVELALHAQPDHPALPRGQWVVLRDFLRYGLDEPTGDGAVRIRPDGDGDRVWLELARGARPCRVTVPRRALAEFLDATERLVPAGEERSEEAVDALLERLLQA